MCYDSPSSEEDDTGYYENLDEFNLDTPLNFDLYEHSGNEAAARQGQVKAFGVQEDGAAIYAEETSDYSVSVQRLLWVDGYEKPTVKGEDHLRQEMTLVVLKLIVSSRDPETKIKYIDVIIRFNDIKTKGKNEPQVQAWAPFRTLEKWNSSTAEREEGVTREIGLKGGYSSNEVSARRSRESRISWEKTSFDSGHSTEHISKVTNNRNGVTWFVKQNDLQNQGATPELWMSLLFARSSSEPYGVGFDIKIRAGKMQSIQNKVKRLFSLGPAQTSAFTVTPRKKTVCNSEGKEILECVDLDKLGDLIGPQCSLIVTWGPKHQASSLVPDQPDIAKAKMHHPGEGGGAKPARAEVLQATMSQKSVETAKITKTVPQNTGDLPTSPAPAVNASSNLSSSLPTGSFSTASNTQLIQTFSQPTFQSRQIGLLPLMIGWHNPGLDSARLSSLESRLAHAEARIAAQDQIILQLQQAKLEKPT